MGHNEPKHNYTPADWLKIGTSMMGFLTTFACVVGAWTVMQQRLDSYERSLSEIKIQVKEIEKMSNERHETLVQLKTDMKNLTTLLEKQQVMIEKLLTK